MQEEERNQHLLVFVNLWLIFKCTKSLGFPLGKKKKIIQTLFSWIQNSLWRLLTTVISCQRKSKTRESDKQQYKEARLVRAHSPSLKQIHIVKFMELYRKLNRSLYFRHDLLGSLPEKTRGKWRAWGLISQTQPAWASTTGPQAALMQMDKSVWPMDHNVSTGCHHSGGFLSEERHRERRWLTWCQAAHTSKN